MLKKSKVLGENVAVEKLSDNTLLVTLPNTPHINNELVPVAELLEKDGFCDVILDFSLTDIITSIAISALLTLQNSLAGNGRKLILCSVNFSTKCIFTAVGLEEAFTFTENKDTTLSEHKHKRGTFIII